MNQQQSSPSHYKTAPDAIPAAIEHYAKRKAETYVQPSLSDQPRPKANAFNDPTYEDLIEESSAQSEPRDSTA